MDLSLHFQKDLLHLQTSSAKHNRSGAVQHTKKWGKCFLSFVFSTSADLKFLPRTSLTDIFTLKDFMISNISMCACGEYEHSGATHKCGGQRTTLLNQFSPSTFMWFAVVKLVSPD